MVRLNELCIHVYGLFNSTGFASLSARKCQRERIDQSTDFCAQT